MATCNYIAGAMVIAFRNIDLTTNPKRTDGRGLSAATPLHAFFDCRFELGVLQLLFGVLWTLAHATRRLLSTTDSAGDVLFQGAHRFGQNYILFACRREYSERGTTFRLCQLADILDFSRQTEYIREGATARLKFSYSLRSTGYAPLSSLKAWIIVPGANSRYLLGL